MFEVKDIAIEDKELFYHYYSQCKYLNSEASFINMFMWQKELKSSYTVIDDFLVLVFDRCETVKCCHVPAGKGDIVPIIQKLERIYRDKGKNLALRPVTGEIKAYLEEKMPGRFDYAPERSYYDYVYSISELTQLKGKKYHSKKNHFNQFVSGYQYQYVPITAANIDRCAQVSYEWIVSRNEKYHSELEAAKKLFENYEHLPVKGAAIEVDGKIAAVTVGEDFHGTVLIHFEKADTQYTGIYAAINRLFLANEWSGYEYVNREEDMGIEGLRKAKLSYHPCRFIEKYTARTAPRI